MKIILLENIKNKGKKNSIIEVNLGYGNFLIKDKKAILASTENLFKREQEQKIKKEENLKTDLLIKKLKQDIEGKEIDIFTKVGPTRKIYGRITSKYLLNEFYKKHNILINSKKIFLLEDIKYLGTYKIKVILTKDISTFFFINIKGIEKNESL